MEKDLRSIKKEYGSLKLRVIKQVCFIAYNATKNINILSICLFSQYLPLNRVIYIYLKDLEYYLTSTKDSNEPMSGKKYFILKFIKNGNWDRNVKRIIPDYSHQSSKYATSFRSTYQIFKNGIHYWHTDEYRMSLKGKGKYIKVDIKDLDDKFKELQNLYLSIKKEGYKSKKQLEVKNYLESNDISKDEVTVAIDRYGNILKLAESGNHRLAIAQILGIEKIPVFIRGVHGKWALNCCKKHKKHLLEAINAELSAMDVENLS